jgi:hypothetical protein
MNVAINPVEHRDLLSSLPRLGYGHTQSSGSKLPRPRGTSRCPGETRGTIKVIRVASSDSSMPLTPERSLDATSSGCHKGVNRSPSQEPRTGYGFAIRGPVALDLIALESILFDREVSAQ